MKEEYVNNDDLPTYEESTISNGLMGTADVTDDGRIEIDLDSKLARTLSFITKLPELSDESVQPPPYSHTAWNTPLNIVIQVVGSRGDVQPFLALGHELQQYGHKVRIATHDVFKDFVNKANLGFYPIGGDPAELMAYMVKNPGLIPEMKTLREGEINKKRKMIKEMLSGCWNACIKPDQDTGEPFVANAIIANPPSFAHIHCAQALAIPVHIMFTMPWSPTQSFPHPLARLRPSKVGTGMANYLSYGLVQALTWQGLADVINAFRKTIDLESVPLTEGPFLAETLKIPHTYCWSPSLVPKPSDWPSHIDVCGFFFRPPPTYDPPTTLQSFLDRGEPPIYIGFGSIVVDRSEEITDTIIEAINISGARAIISTGWSGLGRNRSDLSDNIYLLDEDCPHEWLFPRVAAVVHHGGAGTTACGLANGRPTLVIPFFGDQYFWGDMIAEAGAGPHPIRHQDLSSQNLSDAIQFCLTPQARSRAQSIAEGMRKENGVSTAVASFHRGLSEKHLSCSIDQTSPAIWTYKKSKLPVTLSGRVAEVLIKHEKLKSKHLMLHAPFPIHIENNRWEPTTAVVSAMTGVSWDMLEATNNIWKGPHDIRKRAARDPSTDGSVSVKDVAAMVGSSVMTIPKLYGAMFKGFLVDVPLAVTEGLRATPRLYGDKVETRDPITDWKSGGVVAGKTFTSSMLSATTGLYTQPAKGLEDEGIIGLTKGIGKGVAGFVTKSGAAATGLVAYPAQGISKTIHATFASGTKKTIEDARRVESLYLLERQQVSPEVEMEWVRLWEEMIRGFGQDGL